MLGQSLLRVFLSPCRPPGSKERAFGFLVAMLGGWEFFKHPGQGTGTFLKKLGFLLLLATTCCGTLGKLLYFSGPQLLFSVQKY